MKDIYPVYHNNFGIAFKWKRCTVKDLNKVQLVFRNTGLLLSKTQLIQFSNDINKALHNKCKCSECNLTLLETPIEQVNFSMSQEELLSIQDLIEGAIFQLDLDDLLNNQEVKKPL